MNERFPIQCLIASWVFGVIGLLLGIYIASDLFARFGSIVVLLAVMSEYALLKSELMRLYQSLRGQGAAVCGNTGIPNLEPSRWHQKQALISHITIIVGTFIWGFGDLCLQ
ncbi:hypothetical protein [Agaribacterium haliotis]|uniref:hypothetical protein n=1 Tax=Agaribacterium haliotis TaxID=2013869 RepID=UPI000BB560AE|nr:hypothetical protein [Agaribacterium haliotis]